jgi:hypothetical protein
MEEKLYLSAEIADVEGEKLFVASDSVEDRQGDIIDQNGWDIENFKNNPVIQWAHNPYEPAIGRATKIGYKTINGKKALVYQPEFHKKSEMSKLISDLVDEGYLKASSVGFRPLEAMDNTFTKSELLEISFVNVPANQNALALAYTKGYSKETIKTVFPNAKDIETKAIEYKKYPVSNSDEWNMENEVKNAGEDDLKKMSAYDSKFIHHEYQGYKTNLKGVMSAMAELIKSDIKDKKDAYDHLARHYADFGKVAPALKSNEEIVGKFVEGISLEDNVKDLQKTVNSLIEEMRTQNEERQRIAQENTVKFNESIDKRFADIELNLQGLAEGINPSDGLEERFNKLEDNIDDLRRGVRAIVVKSLGREPVRSSESNKDQERLKALKVLNKLTEAMNKIK